MPILLDRVKVMSMTRILISGALGVLAALSVVGGLVLVGSTRTATEAVAPAAKASASNVPAGVSENSRSADLLASISSLRDLPVMPDNELRALRPRLEQLRDPGQEPSASVVADSAREPVDGVYVARRTDDLPCLVTSKISSCFTAFLDGGIAIAPSSVRASDDPSAAWDITISGIAVDGVKSVEILFADGGADVLEVVNNVFHSKTRGRYSAGDIVGYKVAGTEYSLGG
jgi:hypothetical protein